MLTVEPAPRTHFDRKAKRWVQTGTHGYDAHCGPIQAWDECPLRAVALATETWLDSDRNGYKDDKGQIRPRLVMGGKR